MDHLIFKDVNCVVLVYSITSALSFHMIEDKVHEVIDFFTIIFQFFGRQISSIEL